MHEQHVNARRLGGDLPFHLLRLVKVLDAARPACQQVVSEQHRKPTLPLGEELAQLSAVLDGLWEVEYLVEQERESHQVSALASRVDAVEPLAQPAAGTGP